LPSSYTSLRPSAADGVVFGSVRSPLSHWSGRKTSSHGHVRCPESFEKAERGLAASLSARADLDTASALSNPPGAFSASVAALVAFCGARTMSTSLTGGGSRAGMMRMRVHSPPLLKQIMRLIFARTPLQSSGQGCRHARKEGERKTIHPARTAVLLRRSRLGLELELCTINTLLQYREREPVGTPDSSNVKRLKVGAPARGAFLQQVDKTAFSPLLVAKTPKSAPSKLRSISVLEVRCADGFALALLAASASRSAHGTGSVQVVATLVFRVVSIVSGAVLVMTRML
jgi:hypothetical protein